jgi:Ran GTPase-activating protein (RanGAP) involved in mRNA processing and transport
MVVNRESDKLLSRLPPTISTMNEAERLVFADLLHELGNPQGELMVLADRINQATGSEWPELEQAYQNLEYAYASKLAEKWQLLEVLFDRGAVIGFRIKFVPDQIHPIFLLDPKELRSELPFFFEIRIHDSYSHHPTTWLEHPISQQIESFGLYYNQLYSEKSNNIPSLAQLPRLRHLRLFGNKLGSEGTRLLCRSTFASRLHSLVVANNDIGILGGEALSISPQFTHLNTLDLNDNHLTDAGILPLMRAAFVHQLIALNLSFNEIGVQGTHVLARSPLANLEHLNLQGNNLGDEGTEVLCNSDQVSNLRYLNLNHNKLTGQGFRSLARSPHMAKLTHLDLFSNEAQTDGIVELAQSPHIKHLKSLNLSWNKINDQGALALAQSPNLRFLTNLNLSENVLSDQGAIYLAQSPFLSNLRTLHLSKNRIGEDGLRTLQNADRFQSTMVIW